MNYEKYLPIGTVVKLKEGTKRVMITGFSCKNADDNITYDYNGCLYPEGMISTNKICLFNHNQIETIYHIGLIDNEEKEFKNLLKKVV